MKYCTDDGKHIFNTEQELFAFEEKVMAEKEKKAKLAEVRQAREDEIKSDYKAIMDKIAQYNKDYNEPLFFRETSSMDNHSIQREIDSLLNKAMRFFF